MLRIANHLGLGDAIAFAPLFIEIAKKESKEVEIACWPHNLESIESFFVYHPEVRIKVVEDEKAMFDYVKRSKLKLGVYSSEKEKEGESFIDWIYRQAGCDVNARWDYCPLQVAAARLEQHMDEATNFVIVHDKKEHPIKSEYYSGKRSFTPIPRGSILKYSGMLRRADEIHVIDSSFLHLSEALTTNGKLFWHRYARIDELSNYKLRKDWEIIN